MKTIKIPWDISVMLNCYNISSNIFDNIEVGDHSNTSNLAIKYINNYNLKITSVNKKVNQCEICETISNKLKQISTYKNNPVFVNAELNRILEQLRIGINPNYTCRFCETKVHFDIKSEFATSLLSLPSSKLIEYLDIDDDLLKYFKDNYSKVLWQYIVIEKKADLLKLLLSRTHLTESFNKLFPLPISTLCDLINLAICNADITILELLTEWIIQNEIDFSIIRCGMLALNNLACLKHKNSVIMFDFFKKHEAVFNIPAFRNSSDILNLAIFYRNLDLVNILRKNNATMVGIKYSLLDVLLSNDCNFLDELEERNFKICKTGFCNNISETITTLIRNEDQYPIIGKVATSSYKYILDDNNLGFFDLANIHKYKLGYNKIWETTEFVLFVLFVLIIILIILSLCFIVAKEYKRAIFCCAGVLGYSIVFMYHLIFRYPQLG
jgi:hypothetical protein